MNFKNQTQIQIRSLNQEKLLNEISKKYPLSDINRTSKSETSFKCSFFEYKKVLKILKDKNIEIQKIVHLGIVSKLFGLTTAYGLIVAVLLFAVIYFIQSQFVLQFQVSGAEKLSQTEVVAYIKNNFPRKIQEVDTKEIELSLVEQFEEISFVSCIIKGQTLVVNLKEKLLPDEIYGDFQPIISHKNGKITKIELISGTLKVKVGDIVREGDVLVEPFVEDSSGNIKKVEAKAKIFADVYNEGSYDHFDNFIEIKRTGKKYETSEITLFGLNIYTYSEDTEFEMYEVEYEMVDLIKNIFLPFKMKKTIYYELKETVIQKSFEEVKDEAIEKAKQKALEKCDSYDIIKEEFYTIRHLSGVTIVNFCVVTQQEIGVYYAD